MGRCGVIRSIIHLVGTVLYDNIGRKKTAQDTTMWAMLGLLGLRPPRHIYISSCPVLSSFPSVDQPRSSFL